MATEQLSERVSRLEGGYEHVATKADDVESKSNISILWINSRVSPVPQRLQHPIRRVGIKACPNGESHNA